MRNSLKAASKYWNRNKLSRNWKCKIRKKNLKLSHLIKRCKTQIYDRELINKA